MGPTLHMLRLGTAELNLSLQTYKKELDKVQTRLTKSAPEAKILEMLAPPLVVKGDPERLLDKALQKAESLLQQHKRSRRRRWRRQTWLWCGQGVSESVCKNQEMIASGGQERDKIQRGGEKAHVVVWINDKNLID